MTHELAIGLTGQELSDARDIADSIDALFAPMLADQRRRYANVYRLGEKLIRERELASRQPNNTGEAE